MSKSEQDHVRLEISAPDRSTRIRVLDGAMRDVPLESNLGTVSVDLPPGVYAVHFQLGTEIATETAVLMPGQKAVYVALRDPQALRFPAAAPVPGTSTIRKAHARFATQVSHSEPLRLQEAGTQPGHLMIFARDIDDDELTNPAAGLAVHDISGRRLCDVSSEGTHRLKEGWAGLHVALPEGAYRFRLSYTQDDFIEQTVYVVKGWQTQVFLLVRRYRTLATSIQPEIVQTSILMARPDVGFDVEGHHSVHLTWTESALQALDNGGNVQGRDSNGMLWAKYENPMLGIYGGLLHLRREKIDPGLMRTVCRNLINLVGPLPDVLAIGWALAGRDEATRDDKAFMSLIRRPEALRTPPMLQESWLHLSLASAAEPSLIPAQSFTARVAANLVGSRPWLAWRGEPAAAPVPTASDLQQTGGIRSGFLQALMEFLSAPALGLLLPMADKALRVQDAGHRLYAPEFTPFERKIAHFLDPAIDPFVAKIVDATPSLKKHVVSRLRARKSSEQVSALVRALGVPTASVLSGTWSVVRKLLLQAIPPTSVHLQQFVNGESFEVKSLAVLMNSLQKAQTAIRHRRSGKALTQLEFLYLRYRGRPATWHEGAPPANETVTMLRDADYEDGKTGRALTVESLSRELRIIVDKLRAEAAGRSFGKARLADDWRENFPCPARTYRQGRLFRGAFIEETVTGEAPPIPGNLQLLTGVGPKTESRLNELGIKSVEDIAAKAPEQLQNQLAADPRVLAQFVRYGWDKQAKRLLDGSPS